MDKVLPAVVVGAATDAVAGAGSGRPLAGWWVRAQLWLPPPAPALAPSPAPSLASAAIPPVASFVVLLPVLLPASL